MLRNRYSDPFFTSCVKSAMTDLLNPLRTLLSVVLLASPVLVLAVDSDKDGFDDINDNCVDVVNPGQVDSDTDGLGNRCDADFDNNGVVDLDDLSLFKQNFFGTSEVYDLDDSGGVINGADLGIFRQLFLEQLPDTFWPPVESVVTQDVEDRVADILSRMTLAEKVGQMVMAEITAVNLSDIFQYDLGGILNGGGSWPNGNKASSVADWVALADNYYLASTETLDGGVGIPIIWGTDAVHGHNNVRGATVFPHNIGLGAARNPELMRQIGEVTALEVAVTGIDWVFAPTLAVARNDRWGRAYEAYSEDPQIVREYAGEIVTGLQGSPDDGTLFDPSRVVATAKHWLGDGGTLNGTDQGNAAVSESVLRDIHAQGYFTALEAGAQTVMASYNSWHGFKLHGNEYLLTDVLKGKLGFDGFVIGDWNGHGQVPGCTDNDCAQAINAGVDMIMVPFDWQPLIVNTINQVNNGVIPMSRIDDAVTRILRVKARSGLLDAGTPSSRLHANNTDLLGAPSHRALARQAVRESLVLLKNKDQLLPLDPASKVLVAGTGANNIGMQSGGWTVTWQGTGTNNSDFPQGTSILSGIQSAVAEAGGTVDYSVNGSFDPASPPDVAIVVYGETPYAEGFGDLFNIEYQAATKADLAMLQSLKSQGIPVVSVFISGRPLWMNKELNASDAFVAVRLALQFRLTASPMPMARSCMTSTASCLSPGHAPATSIS